MRVIVWGINYSPEKIGIAPCNVAMCEFLQKAGHEVEMVTAFPYYPQWRTQGRKSLELFRNEHINGVRVRRCWQYVPRKPSAVLRALHEASFTISSFLACLFLRKADVYIVVSPPLLLGAAAWLLTRLKRSSFHLHVQDLQPDAAATLGFLKQGPLLRLLYALESFAYSQAATLSGISPGMLGEFRKKGVPDKKIRLFPNGIDLAVERSQTSLHFREKFGFRNDDFLVAYSGNLGAKQNLDILLDAAAILRGSACKIIICGDGAYRERLAGRIQTENLANVILLPLLDDKDYHSMLDNVDVCVISQQAGSGNAFLPSKLLPALAHRRPIISVSSPDSALASAVCAGKYGINVMPDSATELADAIMFLTTNAQVCLDMGEHGRQYVSQFDQSDVLAQFENWLTATYPVAGGNALDQKRLPTTAASKIPQ